MHLRVSTQRRGDKIYRYAQLVQSCRDKRGRSTQRVVKHLGSLPEPVIEGIRVALKAAVEGQPLVAPSELTAALNVRDVASRRFLDVAVLADCWSHWGLDEVLKRLAGPSEAVLPFATSVLALAVQRCCVPGSKLRATRWVPQTALPEWLGFEPGTFNNTRVHRTLNTLHAVGAELQQVIASKAGDAAGGFRALFMDVTDTWFEGMGCELAEQTRTKSEIPNKRCIALVLLVDEHGFPLRWTVVGGKTKDWTAMRGLLAEIGDVDWIRKTPIVFDRAMGNLTTVAELKSEGLWFLTAAHSSSIASYTTSLRRPAEAFADIELELTDASYSDDIERVARAARAAGLTEIREHLFAIDCGVQQPACELVEVTGSSSGAASPSGRQRRGDLAMAIARAQALGDQRAADPGLTQKALAESAGISRQRVGQLLALLRLNPTLRLRIAKVAEQHSLLESDLRPLQDLAPAAQNREFEHLLRARPKQTSRSDHKPARPLIGAVRLVAYFNPRLFVDNRRRRKRHLEEIQSRVDQVNSELASARRSRKAAPTYRKFSRELERRNYLDAFDIDVEPILLTSGSGRQIQSFRGRVTLKPDVWRRRSTHDGFVLLVGHPELPQTAPELVQLYRDKDVVEKDFQSIKSLIELRPLYHYSDPKVLAHVDVCVLALLLQRTLRKRLRDAGIELTAPAAIELLSRCRLGQRSPHPLSGTYHLTELDAEQQRLLAALDLTDLGDQQYVTARIRPRV